MALKFIIISSLVLRDETERAKKKLAEFVQDYKDVPENYSSAWRYDGTENFVRTQPIDRNSKNLLLKLIDLVKSPRSETKLNQLVEFINRLAQ